MLEIELEALSKCYNPSCRADIEPPGEQHRYCPRCGSAQVFECPACPSRPGAIIRVAEEAECSSCGAMYVQCAQCFHPILITPDQPMSCSHGCDAGLREARTGAHEPLVATHRSGSLTCDFSAPQLPEPEIWYMGEAISRPVCRLGRVFLATARGTLRAVNEDTGRDVEIWEQRPILSTDPAGLRGLTIHVSERYVYFMADRGLVAYSIIDGDPCFELPLNCDLAHCAIFDDRLIVSTDAEQGALTLALYDTKALCRGQDGLLREERLAYDASEIRQPLSHPSATPHAFWVRDPSGGVVRVPMDADKESSAIWANPGYEYVSIPAIRGNVAYLLAHSVKRGTAVIRLGLSDGASSVGRFPDLRAAYIGPRVCDRYLYFFDGARDFCQVDLANLAAPVRTVFVGVDMTGDMTMDTAIALESGEGQGTWLVSLSGAPGDLQPRMVHTSTHARPSLSAPGKTNAALTATDRSILLSDTGTGEIFVYPIPRK